MREGSRQPSAPQETGGFESLITPIHPFRNRIPFSEHYRSRYREPSTIVITTVPPNIQKKTPPPLSLFLSLSPPITTLELRILDTYNAYLKSIPPQNIPNRNSDTLPIPSSFLPSFLPYPTPFPDPRSHAQPPLQKAGAPRFTMFFYQSIDQSFNQSAAASCSDQLRSCVGSVRACAGRVLLNGTGVGIGEWKIRLRFSDGWSMWWVSLG